MTSSRLDLSNTEKPSQIQENMIAYMRLFAGLPGTTMADADVFWFLSGERAPGNSIFKTRWLADNVEAQIDALFAQISIVIDHIDWMIYPGDQPHDLGKRLQARGMPGGPAGNWLWMDLADLGAAPAVSEQFHIEQVRDDAMMAEWTRISGEGFGSDVSIFYDAYARHGYGADAFSLHYIGYLDDVPVTSGTLLEPETPPRFMTSLPRRHFAGRDSAARSPMH